MEQKRLRDLYDKLTQKGVKCMLSNADTSFIRQLYTGFTIENVAAVRTINSDAEGRGKIQEVLIKNW